MSKLRKVPTGFFSVDVGATANHELGPNAADQIAGAQALYRDLFTLFDPGWPDAPVGRLGMYWNMRGEQSDTVLVNLAGVVSQVSRNLTQKSQQTFHDKLKQLLRPTSDATFNEVLVELEVAAALTVTASPISFEPLVPEHLHGTANQPPSPDFGLKFPETLVTVEVTVWHWEALSVWTRLHQEIVRTFRSRLSARGVRRNLHVDLPLSTPQSAFASIVSPTVCRMIADSPTGDSSIEVETHASVRLRWSPLLHFETDDTIDWDALTARESTSFTVGPSVGDAIAVSVNPCLEPLDVESAFKSLRKSIDRKKRQRVASIPHVVAVSLDQQRIGWDMLRPLIATRLWTNPKYRWLAALAEVTDTRVVPNYTGGRLMFNINHEALPALPASMRRALRGEEQFHLP